MRLFRVTTMLLFIPPFLWCAATSLDAATERPPARTDATTQLQVRAIVLPRSVTTDFTIETVEGQNALIVKVKNGVPPYRLTLKNASLARVKQIDVSTFQVTGALMGDTVMEIRDSRVGRVSCDLQIRTCSIVP